MQTAYSKGFNGWSQLAILLGLVGGGIIAGSVLSLPVWQLLAHDGIMNMEKGMLKPENASAVQALQAISAVFMFIIPTIAYGFICYRNGWTFLGFTGKWNPKTLLIILLIMVCSLPLMSLLEQVNRAIPLPAGTRFKFNEMEKKYNEQVLAMIKLKTWGQYLVSLFIIAVLPAISEELAFRGGLQNLLTRWLKSPWVAIIITSILFSAIHLSWYGFFVRFTLGVVLGLVFYYTKNIWLNILLHFLNNALVVTSLFFMARQGKPMDLSAGGSFHWALGVAALVVMVALVRWLVKSSPKPQPEDYSLQVFDRHNPFYENEVAATGKENRDV